MDQLTPEIIHVVCSFLEIKDLRNFRLTCRAYGDIAACHALREVVFYLHYEDFKALEAISRHPIVSKNVNSLVYVAHALPTPMLSFDEFVADYYSEREDHQAYMDLHSLLRNRPSPPLKTRQLRASYRKYKETMEHQIRIIENREDYHCLRDVISRLPALQEIMISSDNWEREAATYKTPFDGCMQRPYVELRPEGCRQLVTVLEAVASAGTQLRKLAAGSLDWRFFRDECDLVKRSWASLANLTVVEFYIDTAIDDDMETAGVEVPECRDVLRTGVLRKFLTSLKHLKGIYVKFTYHSEDHGYAARVGDIIENGHYWPQLSSIGLGNVEGERQDLEHIFDLHKPTLKHVCLEDFCLRNTSWKYLLPNMRQILQLETVCICGAIQGCDEHSDPPVEESWVCGSSFWGPTEVGVAVNDFLKGEGSEMPLKDKDMEWLGEFE
ncbi:uncharacterized protein BCR38DRAFT_353927 [Pseudomassariella vexata]|uniref:F-box domain-containing protein n=1 Tax=Pseudomassariella vexata TaxID=1141098 RepID=A0A1Y2DEW4_9PEZI|nr:uncharacterized protein BCR38DRAFT_353927 [Pseudomassariella vexata]ORY57832.1 hypothetical protein BCR38DRAFT_353927 [Pseudomassariella vexata]